MTKLGVTELGACFPHRVTFHDGCHGLRELGNKKQPRELLAKVQGLELVEMSEAETCCGFGGTFAAKFPMISTAMGEVKCASALETGAEYIVSNDASCNMHIQGLADRQRQPLRTIHLAEVLEHAMSAAAEQFKHDAERLTHDLRHRSLIQTALKKYEVARDAKKSRYRDWQAARQTAAEIKWDAINHLDTYLEEFVEQTRGARLAGALGEHQRTGPPDHPRYHP